MNTIKFVSVGKKDENFSPAMVSKKNEAITLMAVSQNVGNGKRVGLLPALELQVRAVFPVATADIEELLDIAVDPETETFYDDAFARVINHFNEGQEPSEQLDIKLASIARQITTTPIGDGWQRIVSYNKEKNALHHVLTEAGEPLYQRNQFNWEGLTSDKLPEDTYLEETPVRVLDKKKGWIDFVAPKAKPEPKTGVLKGAK